MPNMIKRYFVARVCTVICLAAAGTITGCSSSEPAAPSCDDVQVDAFKELIIVDEDVLSDARGKNAADGPWSFRYAMENMAPEGTEPGAFVASWLTNWVATRTYNGFTLDRELRDATMNTKILCPWYKRGPANACNDDCSSCTSKTLDLAQAPFRLIAITNRIDLREHVANEAAGEGRLTFALTNGAADDPTSAPVAGTVIMEFALPSTRSPLEWATVWHALGTPKQTEEYRAELAKVTDAFVKRGSNPAGVNGSSLGQIRTNESFLNWIWQQREFGLTPVGQLELRAQRNTPGAELNSKPELTSWVSLNKDAILADRYEMPLAMRSASSDALLYQWSVPGIEPKLREAFAKGTCNGCHTMNPTLDTAFHVSPFRKGTEKLSRFVNDPTAPTDEIRARTTSMKRALCRN